MAPPDPNRAPPTVEGRHDAVKKALKAAYITTREVHSDRCRDAIAHRVFLPRGRNTRAYMIMTAEALCRIPWVVEAHVMPLGGWVSASSLLPEHLRPPPSPPRPGLGATPPARCTVACQEARVTFSSDCTCVCEGEFHGGSGHPWRQVGGQLLVARRGGP